MSCECIDCPDCDGSGHVWWACTGEYIGNHSCDDLDDLETCETCGGTGLIEICGECALKEMEEDYS